MKFPTKKEVTALRICLGMTGIAMITDIGAMTILMVQVEMKRLGGQYSLRDAAKIEAALAKKYKKKK